jgi:hypothetical protein
MALNALYPRFTNVHLMAGRSANLHPSPTAGKMAPPAVHIRNKAVLRNAGSMPNRVLVKLFQTLESGLVMATAARNIPVRTGGPGIPGIGHNVAVRAEAWVGLHIVVDAQCNNRQNQHSANAEPHKNPGTAEQY